MIYTLPVTLVDPHAKQSSEFVDNLGRLRLVTLSRLDWWVIDTKIVMANWCVGEEIYLN